MKISFIFSILILLSACSDNSTERKAEIEPTQNEEKKDSSQTKTVSADNGRKKEMLEGLVGDHPLETVSGFMGANTMIDIYRENNAWVSNGSSIEEGMRTGFENELSDEQLSRLNSMHIEVRSDLSVGLYCEGKVYFEVPFSEKGMVMETDPSREYVKYNVFPGEITGMNGFHNGIYYLIASDNFPEGYLFPLDVSDLIQPDFVMLELSQDGIFTMHLRFTDCCDNYSFTFK